METVLLSFLVRSLPPCASRDIPVYLPYGSPKVWCMGQSCLLNCCLSFSIQLKAALLSSHTRENGWWPNIIVSLPVDSSLIIKIISTLDQFLIEHRVTTIQTLETCI